MQAGKLRHRITLQEITVGKDAIGQPIKTWVDFTDDPIPAQVLFPSGLETIKADAPVSVTRASVQIRYLAGVTTQMRVVYDSKNYNILNVLPDSTGRRYLNLACELIA